MLLHLCLRFWFAVTLMSLRVKLITACRERHCARLRTCSNLSPLSSAVSEQFSLRYAASDSTNELHGHTSYMQWGHMWYQELDCTIITFNTTYMCARGHVEVHVHAHYHITHEQHNSHVKWMCAVVPVGFLSEEELHQLHKLRLIEQPMVPHWPWTRGGH